MLTDADAAGFVSCKLFQSPFERGTIIAFVKLLKSVSRKRLISRLMREVRESKPLS